MFARLAYQRVSKAARYGLGKPNRKFVGYNAELSCTTNPRSLPNGHYARPLVLATQRPVREVSAPTQCYADPLCTYDALGVSIREEAVELVPDQAQRLA